MSRLFPLLIAACVCGPVTASSQQPQKPAQERPPVFRAGAHYVRVDAYPSRDGKIVEGLTADDFEVLEDGKPQAVETFQFIKFGAFTSDEERTDPNSQRDAFALAADPAYRVFVLYMDAYHVNLTGSHSLRQPLINMLQSMLGPKDLFGMLTPRQMPRDLILGRQSKMIEEQLGGETNWIWGLQGRYEPEPEEMQLESCGLAGIVPLRRLDKVMSDLDGLVILLGDLRQERKNILVFTRGWVLPRTGVLADPSYVVPPIGVTNAGKLTMGTGQRGGPNELWCQAELQRLSAIDFETRYRELFRSARQANVAFYPVNPTGLEAPGDVTKRPVGPNPIATEMDSINYRNDRLLELAENTDGVAVLNSNNLAPGLKRISNDLSAYYVLGYYTTNSKWDGGIRKISVRLKPSKESVRARREYRAPTETEMASFRAGATAASADAKPAGPTAEGALGELARLRPTAVLLAHGAAVSGEVIVAAELVASAVEIGRWKSGGDIEVIVTDAAAAPAGSTRGRIESGARATRLHVPVTGAGPWTATVRLRAVGEEEQVDRITIAPPTGLLGGPLAYRATPAPASPLRPVGAFQFRRTEQIHVDWPILAPLDRRDARLLGKDGNPLALQVSVSERDVEGRPVLGLDLSLAPLTAGDYVIEVTAGAATTTERRLLAFRVVR